jgi:NTP pyrophosphatase (non-canonical NTP hydrolase)
MELWQIASLLVLIAIATICIWLLAFSGRKKPRTVAIKDEKLTSLAEKDVEQIFNDEFREELRNRGRLHFEKIIGENAMFLQQDLRLTTSQLNDYMKDEIKRVLQDEFKKYEESISTAKDLALETIQKTQEVIEQQRTALEKQMADEATAEKSRLIENFQENMADVVNHYILAAIGNEIELRDQLDYIFQSLEDNKEAIIEDIKGGI